MKGDARTAVGARGEQLALEHMTRLGYRLVTRNHRTRFGEIDLVVSNGHTLAFVEVKTRRRGAGHPFEKLDARKQLQVRRIAAAWLSERPADVPRHEELRFDAIGVTLDPQHALVALEHLEGAF